MEKNTLYDNQDNWLDLANHLQLKVNRRISDSLFLQVRAGFIIVSCSILVSTIVNTPKNTTTSQMFCFIAGIFATLSVFMSAKSMMMGNVLTPLKPEEVISELEKRPNLSREQFAKWMALSYSEANKTFNKVYNTKYTQQLFAVVFLLTSFTMIILNISGIR